MLSANLVIPGQIYDELVCGQGKVNERGDGRRYRRTDACNENTASAWKAKA